jgi:hypothetical protein
MVNIFACDEDPVTAARYLDDKRLGKLGMEAAQLAHYAFVEGTDDGLLRLHTWYTDAPYKSPSAYRNHGVALWTRATLPNLCWLLTHAQALFVEWSAAYTKAHATERVITAMRTALEARGIDVAKLATAHTPHHNAAANDGLGLNFKHLPTTRAYKTYLPARWPTDKRPATYRNRLQPRLVDGMLHL